MTEALLAYQSEYKTHDDYFHGYNLTVGSLKKIAVPTTLITAADDPIIPVDDFERLQLPPEARLIIHRHGGHNGFITGLFSGTWHERFMAGVFDTIESP
jgi:predicted alpha/beta-fold hydrolase